MCIRDSAEAMQNAGAARLLPQTELTPERLTREIFTLLDLSLIHIFLVVVDYAHADDALRNLISTARELNPAGRIITLFGAGGERDRSTRPPMGEAAGSLSDLSLIHI